MFHTVFSEALEIPLESTGIPLGSKTKYIFLRYYLRLRYLRYILNKIVKVSV